MIMQIDSVQLDSRCTNFLRQLLKSERKLLIKFGGRVAQCLKILSLPFAIQSSFIQLCISTSIVSSCSLASSSFTTHSLIPQKTIKMGKKSSSAAAPAAATASAASKKADKKKAAAPAAPVAPAVNGTKKASKKASKKQVKEESSSSSEEEESSDSSSSSDSDDDDDDSSSDEESEEEEKPKVAAQKVNNLTPTPFIVSSSFPRETLKNSADEDVEMLSLEDYQVKVTPFARSLPLPCSRCYIWNQASVAASLCSDMHTSTSWPGTCPLH
jgi:hypothetical protein